MKNCILIYVFALVLLASCQSESSEVRVIEDFNFGWKFNLGDEVDAYKVDFDDKSWREVQLPHDWSVEHSFTQEKTGGATAFLPGGIGWYRKSFTIPQSAKDKIVWIEFDGVYTNSEVWINGQYLGERPFGYAPFSYDLSKHLKFGAENVITVRADRSAYIDSRWYPGSGIYRNVKLIMANKVHIPQWGTFVTTPEASTEKAQVNIKTTIQNRVSYDQKVVVRNSIFYQGERIEVGENEVNIISGEQQEFSTDVNILNPNLWSPESPSMYKLVTELFVNGVNIDRYETPFGVRSFYFDAEKGFFLNGKNTLIKGVCLHHDGGLVGAAVPRGVWERRLQKLKDAGCNAIRTAHNPPSAEFLDICDEMGFLVQDEAFDEFQNAKDKRRNYNQESVDDITKGYAEHFDDWSERDLTNMILRDRNHPSIIMWSIGNEIEWTFPQYGNATGYWGGNKVGDVNYYWDEPPFSVEKVKELFYSNEQEDICAKTAKRLSAIVKKYDTTRPVTANLVIPTVSMFSGYADALDIVGLSYRRAVYDYCRRNYPDKVILGTENWVRYQEWEPVLEHDYMSGIFMWTGIHYMGESRKWPVRGSGSGMLDFAGFENPSYHMFKTLWKEEPHIYITTQVEEKSPYKAGKNGTVREKEEGWADHQKWGWQDVNKHWNYAEGDVVMVEVYTNQPEVELFLNNQSLGVKKLADVHDHILKWAVPYQQGELKALAVNNNTTAVIKTSLEPVSFSVNVDKKTLQADAYDVAHFEVQLKDKDGEPVRAIENEVVFQISGPAKLLGVDNGSPKSVQDYQNNSVVTSEGKCLLIIQSTLEKGEITVEVNLNDKSEKVIIKSI
ncbi:glycoside hydrolase family 2 TIM barrel-domain containing protein [Labilibacter marinus]|uniref:glycoside hydrolase family 2 TIM barrel-domain containing protein n=1 Tax=Labilibacter marinus TaxID=1477105 RepID=UPI00082AA0EC|nr:glycoside hydrolase family 2 TIM barrel-domain containing protein [Labilibacter marinus]